MIDTSLEAHAAAMNNPIRKAMKAAIWEMLKSRDMASDCVYETESFQKDWRHFFTDDHQALQDIRRVMSELQQAEKLWDSGLRRQGIYGRKSAIWTTKNPDTSVNQKLGGQGAPNDADDRLDTPKENPHQAGLISQLRGAHENWGKDTASGKTAEDWRRLADRYARALGKIKVSRSHEEAIYIAREGLK